MNWESEPHGEGGAKAEWLEEAWRGEEAWGRESFLNFSHPIQLTLNPFGQQPALTTFKAGPKAGPEVMNFLAPAAPLPANPCIAIDKTPLRIPYNDTEYQYRLTDRTCLFNRDRLL